MNILVLGSRGMLGSEFMNTLSSYHNMIYGDNIDITFKGFHSTIIRLHPDIIINCAAYTNVDLCESNQEECFKVNGFALENLVGICERQRIKLVHFSTDYVFDGSKSKPYNEEDLCDPINAYGMSKRLGEYNLIRNSSNYLLIRSSWLYGKYGNNFVSTMITKARNREVLAVVDDQIGHQQVLKI